MPVITLRNLPPELVRIIQRRARAKRTSLTRAVIDLLAEAAGVRPQQRDQELYHDLDALAGAWTPEEAEAFAEALGRQRVIDQSLWK